MRLENARYHLSVHDPRLLPSDSLPEVAFIGRSNAGKSSALNTLAGRRRLAFVSKTPGRTQLINFFGVDEDAFLVDLPGYGYAGVPLAVRQHWDTLVGEYIFHRRALAGVVVVMDARHPLTPQDRRLLDWLFPSGRSVHVLLSKSDKLSAQAALRTLTQVRKDLAQLYPGASAQLFSSLKRTGMADAQACIESWVAAKKQEAPAKGD
ncbi:MAG: YihA family ribosome biogenesis GTP-binding protein [Betaproteobacteria bacterium]|nr:YihA family ribosome biogenesis GTP-binding protein [Betaproteobacteria bacterium]